MSRSELSSARIREDGFANLEGLMLDLGLFAEATAFVVESSVADRLKADQELTLSYDTARRVDFMVAELARRCADIERQWSAAHNAACHAEGEEYRRAPA